MDLKANVYSLETTASIGRISVNARIHATGRIECKANKEASKQVSKQRPLAAATFALPSKQCNALIGFNAKCMTDDAP